jgi:beta-lactamase class A
MKWLGLFLASVILCLAGFWAGYEYRGAPPVARQIRDTTGEYRLISPLIAVSLGPKELFPQYEPVREAFADLIDRARAEGAADQVSVYFRDLNSGMWTGVGETDLYAPSSMLKVVAMLAYLDYAEDDPSAIDKLLPYGPTGGDGEYFQASSTLPAGSYPARVLIERMVVDSDNDALTSVFGAVEGKVAEVNRALGLPVPASGDPAEDFMSPRAYSLVFRTLYNSTYLSRDVSEKALELLSRTTFSKGIVAGVPAGMMVAHKFGERTDIVAGHPVLRELHDCGIVYVPDNPYLLCVMTKGSDFESLASVIADISHAAYVAAVNTDRPN